MDLHTKCWVPKILESIGEDLKTKLGEVRSLFFIVLVSVITHLQIKLAHSVAGKISSYFVDKYNFNKNCTVITCSGDNPCSLAALKLAVVSTWTWRFQWNFLILNEKVISHYKRRLTLKSFAGRFGYITWHERHLVRHLKRSKTFRRRGTHLLQPDWPRKFHGTHLL